MLDALWPAIRLRWARRNDADDNMARRQDARPAPGFISAVAGPAEWHHAS